MYIKYEQNIIKNGAIWTNFIRQNMDLKMNKCKELHIFKILIYNLYAVYISYGNEKSEILHLQNFQKKNCAFSQYFEKLY